MQKGKLTQKVGQVPKENLAQYHVVNNLLEILIEILVEILVEKQITNSWDILTNLELRIHKSFYKLRNLDQ